MHETSTKRLTTTTHSPEPDEDGWAAGPEPVQRRPPPGLALDPPEEPAPPHEPEIPVERLDPDALKVIARLRHMGHQAYFVGGCVRDLLLDRIPKDFDVATDAHPGEVRAIFRNCRLIGRRFRLAHVYFRGGKVIEVATFRKNPVDVGDDVPDAGDLLITRDNVFGTAEEDALRRDFTVNGLFYDVAHGEVIDYVGGRADLEAHRIATIGDPEIRMREDPVRTLRAVRFAARLGFSIAPDTFEAMRRHAGELARCAPARLLEEIFKILRCGGSARAFELLRACGALPVVLPALGAALESWDEARRKSFFAHLAALDRLVRSGEEVSEAVLLGALLMHLSGGGALGPPSAGRGRAHPSSERDVPASSSPPDGHGPSAPVTRRPHDAAAPPMEGSRVGEAEGFLASLVSSSRLPRRIAERTRLALQAQRTLRNPQRRRRRRGRGPGGRPPLADAIQLLQISVEATGEGSQVLARVTGTGHGHDEPPASPRGEADLEREQDAAGGAPDAGAPEVAIRAVGDATGAGDASGTAGAAEGPGERPAPGRKRRRRGGRRRRRRGPAASASAGHTPDHP